MKQLGPYPLTCRECGVKAKMTVSSDPKLECKDVLVDALKRGKNSYKLNKEKMYISLCNMSLPASLRRVLMSIDILKGQLINAKLWVHAHNVESSALDQIRNICALPGVVDVAIMPDCHTGKGCVVGGVVVTKDIIPVNLVGVDIGCGMDAVRTNLKVPRTKKLEEIRDNILERIPVGFNSHNKIHRRVKEMTVWSSYPQFDSKMEYHQIAMQQMGTLGGGNHFIELSTDQNNDVWIIIHSGSRRIGKEIADFHIRAAMNLEHNQTGLPDKALAYFIREEGSAYIKDLIWAQKYAQLNRIRMVDLVMQYLTHEYPSFSADNYISCHHNYATSTDDGYMIIRKGAISARKGQLGIIPGAMGAKSYIVEGLGNKDAWDSAPHGAGRKMSRSQAKKKYSLQDLEKTMKNIVNNACKSTIDEISYSYKDIDTVIELSKDLVKPIFTLEQIMNIKG